MEGERGPCHRYNRVGAVNKKTLWWHDAVRKSILVFLHLHGGTWFIQRTRKISGPHVHAWRKSINSPEADEVKQREREPNNKSAPPQQQTPNGSLFPFAISSVP
ncbi:hypothetical protein VNO80_20013 [Phaseolus coccineus]|uniref:Uncharacterized protein n=1 Tax=Phaseolus coccineus TaxID=3886 RepID=A0AAN9MND6_PHACN